MKENMVVTQSATWQDLYEAAMLEIDPSKLQTKIEFARVAIQQQRQEEFVRARDAGAVEGRGRLADALENLRPLQRLEFTLATPSARESDNPLRRRGAMKRICRQRQPRSRRRLQWISGYILRHAKIVTDPETLAYLRASVERCNSFGCTRLVPASIDGRLVTDRQTQAPPLTESVSRNELLGSRTSSPGRQP